jgi:type IV pilus assembly protein PilB
MARFGTDRNVSPPQGGSVAVCERNVHGQNVAPGGTGTLTKSDGTSMQTKHQGLGSLLVGQKLLTEDQLGRALQEQKTSHERLGAILLRLGYVREADLVAILARQLGLPIFDPAVHKITPEAVSLVPEDLATRYDLVPVNRENGRISVAMVDPLNLMALDDLRFRTQTEPVVMIGLTEDIAEARLRHYAEVEGSRGVQEALAQASIELGAQFEDAADAEELDSEEARRRAQDAPIVNLVNKIITQALVERATDIHIEPLTRGLVVRFRVDGLLYDAITPPRGVYTGVMTRVKILSDMDIAERRKAQDGRFSVKMASREVDVRVSTIPTIHGEKAVLRLLDKSTFDMTLTNLGFDEETLGIFRTAIHQPYGMVLLSGPTGSGKSTTLYAALLELKNATLNITTVEDPVEYQIDRINQVQVNEKKGVTFANTLRSFLRQDPDVMMVGEIRDRDTADMAVRAAMTGHMVFSTIHANDAPSTAVRLTSLGAEPFQSASALTLVVAQRLLRRNCMECLEPYAPPEELLTALRVAPERAAGMTFRKGKGCAQCRDRGYHGRVAIVEPLRMTSRLRNLVAEGRPADEIRRAGLDEGMITLRESGLRKVATGMTTVEEVLRVCLADD